MRTVGVDLGGTKCLAVALEEGTVVDERRVPTPVGETALLDALAEVATSVGAGPDVLGVGVGVPGLVDRGGVLRFAPNLPGVVDLDIKAELERRLGGRSGSTTTRPARRGANDRWAPPGATTT